MSYQFRPGYGLLGLLLLACPVRADVAAPQMDPSRPHPLPITSACPQPTGVTVVAVHVNELGRPFAVEIDKSSGCEALDKAGLEAVRRWHFVPASSDGDSIAEWTAVGFQFDGTKVVQVDVPPDTDAAKRDREHVVCRKEKPMTGSNIDPAPVCMAKWQWDERARQEAEARRRVHVPTKIGNGSVASPTY